MTKEEFIQKRGIEAWERHLEVSRLWTSKNKERHVQATRTCRKKKPEYYKRKSDMDNIKYADLKSKWKKEHSIKLNAKYRPELKHNRATITGKFKKYCNDAICLIENYYIALQDNFKGWCIHHRLELHPDYSVRFTSVSLKKLNLYYNRPARELIFLRTEEHSSMHHLNRKRGSKYVDTNKISVNSLTPKEYHRQYSKLRWENRHE